MFRTWGQAEWKAWTCSPLVLTLDTLLFDWASFDIFPPWPPLPHVSLVVLPHQIFCNRFGATGTWGENVAFRPPCCSGYALLAHAQWIGPDLVSLRAKLQTSGGGGGRGRKREKTCTVVPKVKIWKFEKKEKWKEKKPTGWTNSLRVKSVKFWFSAPLFCNSWYQSMPLPSPVPSCRLSVCVCVCVFCVWERERERNR